MSRCNPYTDWSYIEPDADWSYTAPARPEALYVTTTRPVGRKTDLVDRKEAGSLLHGFRRLGLHPISHGGHRYTVSVPASPWHAAFIVDFRPA
jgi:hypothetical protein